MGDEDRATGGPFWAGTEGRGSPIDAPFPRYHRRIEPRKKKGNCGETPGRHASPASGRFLEQPAIHKRRILANAAVFFTHPPQLLICHMNLKALFLLLTSLLVAGSMTLPLGVYGQPADAPPPLRLDFSWVMTSRTFGGFTADLPELREITIESTPDFDLRLSYGLHPRLRLGIAYTGHGYRHKAIYLEPERQGTLLPDPNRGNQTFLYTRTENWRSATYHHWGLYAEAGLVSLAQAGLSLRLGVQSLLLRQIDYYIPFYQGGGIDSDVIRSVSRVPGLEGGLVGHLHLNPNVRLTLAGAYVQGLNPTRIPHQSPYRYAHLAAGLQLGLGTGPAVEAPHTRKNTVMAGAGFPFIFSLSYERLLWIGQAQHSLRAFVDQWFIFETLLGGAYNVKVGKDRHYFLAEALFFVPESLSAGAVVGYVYQDPSGLVFRAEIGGISNQMGLGENARPVYPRLQVHIGYAFR